MHLDGILTARNARAELLLQITRLVDLLDPIGQQLLIEDLAERSDKRDPRPVVVSTTKTPKQAARAGKPTVSEKRWRADRAEKITGPNAMQRSATSIARSRKLAVKKPPHERVRSFIEGAPSSVATMCRTLQLSKSAVYAALHKIGAKGNKNTGLWSLP